MRTTIAFLGCIILLLLTSAGLTNQRRLAAEPIDLASVAMGLAACGDCEACGFLNRKHKIAPESEGEHQTHDCIDNQCDILHPQCPDAMLEVPKVFLAVLKKSRVTLTGKGPG